MKKLPVGLVVEGNSTKSVILRLPKLGAELGPIKSPVRGVARRVSNFLHAGFPINDYAELSEANLILMRVPDEAVPHVVSQICDSGLELKNLAFVLCETWLVSDALQPLVARGAFVASIIGLPGGRRNWFAVEGDRVAVRQMRRLMEASEARTFELRPGTKPLFFAAGILANTLPMPLLLTAQQALREAGLSGNYVCTLVEEMAQGTMRDFAKGARLEWSGPMGECSAETANKHLEALRTGAPGLAGILDYQFAGAQRTMTSKQKHRTTGAV